MQAYFRTALVVIAAILASCATVPGENKDIVVSGEAAEGPGVFSGERGEIVFFADDEASAPGGDAGTGQAPRQPAAADWKEFEAFKRWLKAREEQDDDYREFLQWRQFEAYKTWQQKP